MLLSIEAQLCNNICSESMSAARMSLYSIIMGVVGC